METTQPKKKRSLLPLWILIGMFAGILVGLLCLWLPNWFNHPEWKEPMVNFTTNWLKPIGDIYINLLKFLIVPVVLISITTGVISLGDLKKVGSIGIKTFLYYLCTTAIAVVVGLVIVNFFKGSFPALPGANLTELEYQAKEAPKVMDVIKGIFPDNALKPLVNADMLPVICIAIFLGAGILAVGKKADPITNLVNAANEVVIKILMMIIKITPIGVFCLMANVVAVNGPMIIGSLALVIGVAYLAYLVHIIVVYGLSVQFLSRMNPFKFFRGMMPAMITAFTTTSSNATLPVNLECCTELGADKGITSFVLPLGATINMDGTAIYQAVAAVFIASCYGMSLTFGQMAQIVLTAVLASIGTAGVSGAGPIMLAMVLAQIGVPVEGIALIIGVDKIFDMGRTTLNITGDATCAIWISRLEQRKAAKKAAKQA